MKQDLNCDNHPLYWSETSYGTAKMLDDYQLEFYEYEVVLNLNNEGEEDYDLNDIFPMNKAWQNIVDDQTIMFIELSEKTIKYSDKNK